MSVRYLGSKARIVEQIVALIGPPDHGGQVLIDGFCGTGVVAETAARAGWSIRINDSLMAATVISAARLASRKTVPFIGLGGYESAIEQLNAAQPKKGFIQTEYSPASAEAGAVERRYFTEDNASRIDGIRYLIEQWATRELTTQTETNLLLADLLIGVDRVANIAGTFGCFLADWSTQALRPLKLTARALFPVPVVVETVVGDVITVPVNPDDVVYLDPPYTKRQYAAYYHVLETVTRGDRPIVGGVTGLRPWQDKASDYCYRRKALASLVSLIADMPAKRIFLSYSSEGHVQLDDLAAGLCNTGNETVVWELGEIGRYRSNMAASAKASSVKEYVIEIAKSSDRSALSAPA